MIALQTLKYKIFEWCLDTLINKVYTNFHSRLNINGKSEVQINDLYVGIHLTEIIHNSLMFDNPFIFKDCVIKNLLSIYKNDDKNDGIIRGTGLQIEFTFDIFNNNRLTTIKTHKIYCQYNYSDDTRFYI